MGMNQPLPERVYCAGPYNPLEWSSTKLNIARAMHQAQKVRELGFVPVCPHVAVFEGTVNEEAAMQECFSHLETCDALVLLEDWTHSRGTLLEKERAEKRGIAVFESVNALAVAKADELPVTLNGLVRILWFYLARIIERECKAGMQPPALMSHPWHHRFRLFECFLNGRLEPASDPGSRVIIPPSGLLVEYAGEFVCMVTPATVAIREGQTDKFRQLVKAARDESPSGPMVVQ